MSSRSLLVYGFLALFFISIFVFYFFIKAGAYHFSSLVYSLVISLPAVLYVYFRRGASKIDYAVVPGFYTPASPFLSIIFLVVVVCSLLLVDLQDFKIERDSIRELSVYVRLISLHLVLAFFVILFYFSKNKNSRFFRVFVVLCLGLSFYIAYLEGRRTSILIPVLLLALFELSSTANFRRYLIKLVVFVFAFFAFFGYVTIVRTQNLDSLPIVFEALLSRLFNPGHMVLEVVSQSDYAFEPHSVVKSFERLGYVFGLSDYHGSTNSFGRYYGFLSANNYSVGINPGIILELFLSFSWLYIFAFILLFEFSLHVMSLYRRLLYKADLFVAILVLHGMQMEVPYLIGLLVKLFIFAQVLLILSYFSPRRRF